MKTTATAFLAAMAMAAPAFAGTLGEPPVEPVIAAPAAPAPVIAARDWTGAYVGGRLGWGDLGRDVDGDGAIGGLFAGYLFDFGGFAAGVEAGYDAARINVDDSDGNRIGRLTEVGRLMVRGGPTIDNLFVYGTAGVARAHVSNVGSDNGWAAGIGAEFDLGGGWSVGGEVLHHRFDDFRGSGLDVRANTFQARAAFRF
jgi:outer membrane immunogenic protein